MARVSALPPPRSRHPAGHHTRRRGLRAFAGALVLAASLPLGGCVERTLLFTSDPIGAHVTVNGKDVGVTPVTIPFIHNQRFEYRIEKDGYRSVTGDVTTPSTWDSRPGPDFFAENLPGHIRRQTVRHVALDPLPRSYPRGGLEAQLREAEAFRARAESETGGPNMPPPTRPDRIPPPPPHPTTKTSQAAPPASR